MYILIAVIFIAIIITAFVLLFLMPIKDNKQINNEVSPKKEIKTNVQDLFKKEEVMPAVITEPKIVKKEETKEPLKQNKPLKQEIKPINKNKSHINKSKKHKQNIQKQANSKMENNVKDLFKNQAKEEIKTNDNKSLESTIDLDALFKTMSINIQKDTSGFDFGLLRNKNKS